jgi:prepilin-type N-terminal cleavage/methylation domain-containing protein
MKHTKGFTLIELLVVVAIISLLSTIVMASLNSARSKSRDAKRAEDIHQIQIAVEMYFSDNGHYPNSNNTWASFDSPTYSPSPIISPAATNLAAALKPYIGYTFDPKPVAGAPDGGYLYISATGADYCILFWRTPENLKNFGSSYVNYLRCTGGIDTNGQCLPSTMPNSIYIGTGQYSGGC